MPWVAPFIRDASGGPYQSLPTQTPGPPGIHRRPPDGIRARAKSSAHDCPAGTGSVKHAAPLIGAAAGRRRLAVVYSETEQPSDASYRGGDG